MLLGGNALLSGTAAHGQSLAAGATGRVTGTVTLGPSVAARKAPPRLYAGFGPRPSGTTAAADTNELLNVVVYVELAPGVVPDVIRQSDRPVMRQRNEAFLPHVLPLLRGSTVTFTNEDPYFHNVFSLSPVRTFDLGRFANGSRTLGFTKPGIVQVFCHIHANMSAVVLVLDTPLFVIPDGEGRFAIDGVPAGHHTIVAWHERTGRLAQQFTVRDGEATAVTLHLPDTARSGR